MKTLIRNSFIKVINIIIMIFSFSILTSISINYDIYNDSGIFASYINMRVILPVYSVLIPFYISQYKNENLSKEEKRFVINILRNYIKLNSSLKERELN